MALLRHAALLSCLAIVTPLVLAAGAPHALTEAQAKAGFLYNCAMFVEWPPAAVAHDELVIGVIGDDAVSAVVEDMQGQKVNGLRLRVDPVGAGDALDEYHILFVGARLPQRAVLARIGNAPVLTVGEHPDFTADGGIVRLYMDQGRIRFEINLTRVEDTGLRVSAKMLGLARIVR